MSGSWREPYVPQGAPLLYRSWANYPVYNFSYSLALDIDSCGQKTIYNRFQGLAEILESASFKFGICCEEAIVESIRIGGDAEQGFIQRWLKFKDVPLKYTKRDSSWSKLFEIGKALMRMFTRKLKVPPLSDVLVNPDFGVVYPLEQDKTWYKGTRLDYIADVVGNPLTGKILMDFKTAGSSYGEDQDDKGYAALDPQLLTGALASGIRDVGFIALIKTNEPKVEFVRGRVTDKMVENIDLWLREQYDKLVEKRLFMRTGVRWPNEHCKLCSYLCKCLGNEELASRTLRQKQSKNTAEQLILIDEM
jgi:hypothetical protein